MPEQNGVVKRSWRCGDEKKVTSSSLSTKNTHRLPLTVEMSFTATPGGPPSGVKHAEYSIVYRLEPLSYIIKKTLNRQFHEIL